MNYFEKNMECIKKNRSFMYKMMQESDISSTANRVEWIETVVARDSNKTIIFRYQSKEYRLNSIYSPVKEAEQWAEQFTFHNLNNLVSMFGFGTGEFVRAILRKIKENDMVVIYEPSADIFYYVLNNYDISDILLDQRVSLSIEKINEFEFHNSLRGVIDIVNIMDQVMCSHPYYDQIFQESCVNFWKELKDSYYNARLNINTEIYFGKRFIDNTLNNIKYLHDSCSLSELKEQMPKNTPAIIIAAGPSVGKQLEEIKRAKGKTVIFAVDRILEFLLEAGVYPNFIVTIDPLKPVKYFTSRTDVKIPLISFLESNYEILDRHAGKKIVCNCSAFMEKSYKDVGILPPRTNSSASVATVAFTICVEMGFKDIILVGQDLAYDGEQSHSGNVEEHYGTEKDLMIEDIHGKMVRSRFDWKEFVVWYQDFLTIVPELNVIDAKDKGAKIKGTTVMPLKEALDKFCTGEFDEDTLVSADNRTFSSKDLHYVKEYLLKNLTDIGYIKKKSRDSIKICDKLIEGCITQVKNPYVTQELVKKLTQNNEFIQKQSIYLLMDKYIMAVSAQFVMEISQFKNDQAEDTIDTYRKAKNIYEAIVDAADYIKPKLADAIEQVMPNNQ